MFHFEGQRADQRELEGKGRERAQGWREDHELLWLLLRRVTDTFTCFFAHLAYMFANSHLGNLAVLEAVASRGAQRGPVAFRRRRCRQRSRNDKSNCCHVFLIACILVHLRASRCQAAGMKVWGETE